MGSTVNIEEYQKRAVATALPTALNYDYLIPGLVAEVGEVFGKVAKSVRDEWSREVTSRRSLRTSCTDNSS